MTRVTSVTPGTAASRRPKYQVDGVLLVDKPEGPSSNQVLQRVKWLFQAKKAGHTGTLDPFASGLLPIMFGEATKFSSFLLQAAKTYDATILLGVSTTTGDITGEVVATSAVAVDEIRAASVVGSFLGERLQVPPMHSALKRDGVPLYKLARRGEVVVREARAIVIHELAITRMSLPEIDVRVRCSKGTYVRVLAEDIGKALGCSATLTRLRRTGIGEFSVDGAVRPDELDVRTREGRLACLLPVDAGLDHLPMISLGADEVNRLRLGQSLAIPANLNDDTPVVRLYAHDAKRFLGMGRTVAGVLSPLRLVVYSNGKKLEA